MVKAKKVRKMETKEKILRSKIGLMVAIIGLITGGFLTFTKYAENLELKIELEVKNGELQKKKEELEVANAKIEEQNQTLKLLTEDILHSSNGRIEQMGEVPKRSRISSIHVPKPMKCMPFWAKFDARKTTNRRLP